MRGSLGRGNAAAIGRRCAGCARLRLFIAKPLRDDLIASLLASEIHIIGIVSDKRGGFSKIRAAISRPGAGIRLSPHFYTTDDELEHAVAEIAAIVASGAGGASRSATDQQAQF